MYHIAHKRFWRSENFDIHFADTLLSVQIQLLENSDYLSQLILFSQVKNFLCGYTEAWPSSNTTISGIACALVVYGVGLAYYIV